MKKSILALTAILATGLLAGCSTTTTPGEAKTEIRVITSGVLTVSATIEAIDYQNRLVTLDNGHEQEVIYVSAEVKNFEQLEVGDQVEIDYKGSTAVFVQERDGKARIQSSKELDRNNEGDKPGVEVIATVQTISDIVALDKEARVVTLKGPNGKELTMPIVDDNIDLTDIDVGDQVVVVHTRAVAIVIRPAATNPEEMGNVEISASENETESAATGSEENTK